MQHWIFNVRSTPLPAWLEAMPDAVICAREQINDYPLQGAGIIWCRLRAGESVDAVLPIRAREEGQKFVLLCDEPDELLVMAALSAGVDGCCNSFAAPEVLRQVALVVTNGGLWVGQSLLQRLLGSTSRFHGQPEKTAKNDEWTHLVSGRELQVARLVAEGASNKEIARQLSISERTVKAHLSSIFEKLSVRDRLQLSLKVNGLGL